MLKSVEAPPVLRTDADQCGKLVEVFTAALYASVLRPVDVAVDGGVCKGMHPIPISHLVRDEGTVYGFEANPALLSDIERRIENEGAHAARLFGKALRDTPGHMKFLPRRDNIGLSQIVS